MARNRRGRRLRQALALAFVLHLVFALLLPKLPPLIIPAIDRGAAILVYLEESAAEELFKQSLNNPASLVAESESDLSSSGFAATASEGDDDNISEPAPDIEANRSDQHASPPSGQDQTQGIEPTLFITRSMISFFAQQEAFLIAESEPDDLKRFARSFHSVRSYRKRSRTENFANRYGDYYVRNSSSVGDICYLQQKDEPELELSTRTVLFFRCDSKPQDFTID